MAPEEMRRPPSVRGGTMSTRKPSLGAGRRKEVRRARAVLAEVEVEPDHRAGDRQPLDQHAGDEFVGREIGERAIECEHDCAIEAGRGQEPQLGGLLGQPESRHLRAEEAQRMRLKR